MCNKGKRRNRTCCLLLDADGPAALLLGPTMRAAVPPTTAVADEDGATVATATAVHAASDHGKADMKTSGGKLMVLQVGVVAPQSSSTASKDSLAPQSRIPTSANEETITAHDDIAAWGTTPNSMYLIENT
ncbi:hypothetical protein ACH5RR_001203 [Cinchona calisaya]|uniref:Uncharacterized protein n=1 Tax=Cinchona calisaya TaxID=153742 RepID=A0ABD3B3X4_9GENT